MSGIKAIETRYKGYRFRSRLEARWAVLFDALGWRWLYEHEGYETAMFGERVCWLPDFYLPDFGWLVEVKADWAGVSDEDAYKVVGILDWHCGPPFLYGGGGILLLGDVPFGNFGDECPVFLGLVHERGVRAHPTWLDERPRPSNADLGYADSSWSAAEVGAEVRRIAREFDPYDVAVLETRDPFDGSLIVAMRAARSARFEHGEAPR